MNDYIDNMLRNKIVKLLERPEMVIEKDSLLIDDIGLNSLRFMMLLFEIEEEWKCDCNILQFKGIKTYGELLQTACKIYDDMAK